MKTRTIAYWIATVFVTLIMTASGVLAISHAPALYEGAIASLITKLKEWAYVAFGLLYSVLATPTTTLATVG